jgi:hypothetical protein
MDVLNRSIEAGLARDVVRIFGGRYSTALGIDVDGGDNEVERWFLAATLFGARISGRIAARTFRVLDRAGLSRMAVAGRMAWQDLVDLLDEGGYVRYDFRTATRLQAIAAVLRERYGDRVAAIARRHSDYPSVRAALDELPGWGPVTVGLFLRELREVWDGAQPPLDDRARLAARHLGLPGGDAPDDLARLRGLADAARLDVRDLESGLVRLALAHHAGMNGCPGGSACVAVSAGQGGPR